MKRRDALKDLSLLPLAGSIMLPKGPAGSKSVIEAAANKEIYESIGVEPIINCRGTFTIIGGSIEKPEVRAAMDAAAQSFVQYDELAFGAGKRLAELTGAEWGLVSSGCAAGMKHITVACVTGGNPEKLIRVPDLSGFEKTEVIIPRYSRNVYDHAIRNVGVKIITVDSIEELQNAISSRTALIYIMAGGESETGPLSTASIAKVAGKVPILVDAAAEDLTIPNIHLKNGATVVVYSGGKAMCGPQCAGLVLGKKDLLMSAWQASAPITGPAATIKSDGKKRWEWWRQWKPGPNAIMRRNGKNG